MDDAPTAKVKTAALQIPVEKRAFIAENLVKIAQSIV
jgi:hypothetical protein